MPLPTSGPISNLQVAEEFGGTAPHSLSEYYGVAVGVPAAGAISLAHFYGKSKIRTYQFIRIEFADVGVNGYANAAEIRLALNGAAIATPGSINASSQWAGQPPVLTIDNDANSYWSAGASGNGHWVQFYYGGQVNFDGLWIMPGITYNNVNTIRVWATNGANTGPFELLREFTGLAGTWVKGQYKVLNKI